MPLNKVNYVDGQTIISAQNMNDIQDEVIRLGEKEIVQSDWLEQDENSLAYVKNKPFGVAGQYRVACTTETMLTSGKLIEINTRNDDYNNQMNDSRNNGSNVYYLYKVSSGMLFDIMGIGLYQKIAFEYSSGQYLTIQDLKNGGGNIVSLSLYIDNPNVVSGKVYFYGDITYDLATSGIVLIEDSSDSILTPGLYVAFNAQKKSQITKVLINSSYLFNAPGALSMIDMPLAVNYAVMALDGLKQPLQPMVESVQESLNSFSSALDNKVDKIGNKVLSDVNFTKAYENAVKSIDTIKSDISNLSMRCSDLEDIFLSGAATLARATEIAANPYGVSLSAQNIGEELGKLALGQNSDKIFADEEENIVFIKMSDKIPTPEDISKGFTMVVSMLNFSSSVLPSMIPMSPYCYIHIGNMEIDSNGWSFVDENLVITDGMMVFLEGLVIIVNDINNPFGLPKGVYTTILPEEMSVLCSGLQISGFDLSSSTAPVSRAQIEDILLFIEESTVTFTVNGVSHRAIKGMTWGEWVNSRYNDTELTVVTHWQAGQMIGISSGYILRPHSYVRPNEVIQEEEYSLGREVSEPT